MRCKILSKTCTTVAGAYSSGDIVGTSNEVQYAVGTKGGSSLLKSITLVSNIITLIAWDVYLFSSEPTIASADNAALDISDAEMTSKLIGVVSLVTGDGKANAANAVSTKTNINLPLKGSPTSESVYAVIVAVGSWTAAGTADVTLKLGVEY